eukprot:TRINITY_DN10466_c0_g2_i2.p1 TRINITY_DN10466_c0_g2~~TRINITY_DN10466_c0_g2_i2.p1  ORF type:complete len:443 (+),score=47.48 TRINITY_DN10466_c0_g2_i2:52-1329(+)
MPAGRRRPLLQTSEAVAGREKRSAMDRLPRCTSLEKLRENVVIPDSLDGCSDSEACDFVPSRSSGSVLPRFVPPEREASLLSQSEVALLETCVSARDQIDFIPRPPPRRPEGRGPPRHRQISAASSTSYSRTPSTTKRLFTAPPWLNCEDPPMSHDDDSAKYETREGLDIQEPLLTAGVVGHHGKRPGMNQFSRRKASEKFRGRVLKSRVDEVKSSCKGYADLNELVSADFLEASSENEASEVSVLSYSSGSDSPLFVPANEAVSSILDPDVALLEPRVSIHSETNFIPRPPPRRPEGRGRTPTTTRRLFTAPAWVNRAHPLIANDDGSAEYQTGEGLDIQEPLLTASEVGRQGKRDLPMPSDPRRKARSEEGPDEDTKDHRPPPGGGEADRQGKTPAENHQASRDASISSSREPCGRMESHCRV